MTYPGEEDDRDIRDEHLEESWNEEEQLTLADDDEDLPWLEAEDYEEDEGFDFRLIWIALVGLLLIAAALFAVWWFMQDRADPELAAEGSTIEAPEGAYKQRPDNPGGAEVEGTGDQAFATAEGESTRGRIADDARPSIDPSQGADAPEAEAADAPSGASSGSVYVQIGAFSSREDADSAWSRAVGRYSVLSGKGHRIQSGEVNGATVYRLQVAAGDRASADATCRAIRQSGGDCYIR